MSFESLLLVFVNYPKIITFVGSVLGGESVILFLSALSGQGAISLWVVYVFCFFGTIFSDSLWFLIPKSRFFKRIVGQRVISKGYTKIVEAIDKISHKKNLVFFVVAKFLYGTRIIFILYISDKNFKYRKFLAYDSFATAFWLGVLIPIGWLSGRGLKKFVDIFNDVQLGMSITIGIVLVFYIARQIIDKKIKKFMENEK